MSTRVLIIMTNVAHWICCINIIMAFTHRPSWLYYIDCQQARQIFSQPPFLKCVTKFAGFQRRSEQTVIVEFHETQRK